MYDAFAAGDYSTESARAVALPEIERALQQKTADRAAIGWVFLIGGAVNAAVGGVLLIYSNDPAIAQRRP